MASIYLHVSSPDGLNHRFLRIKQFNAVTFNPEMILLPHEAEDRYQFSWLLAGEVEGRHPELPQGNNLPI